MYFRTNVMYVMCVCYNWFYSFLQFVRKINFIGVIHPSSAHFWYLRDRVPFHNSRSKLATCITYYQNESIYTLYQITVKYKSLRLCIPEKKRNTNCIYLVYILVIIVFSPENCLNRDAKPKKKHCQTS